MVTQVLILAFVLLVVPIFAGGCVSRVDGMQGNLVFRWIGGQFLLWAGFQVICVPLILKEREFGELVNFFWLYMVALALLAAARQIRRWRGKVKAGVSRIEGFVGRKSLGEMILWAVFWGVLLFQLVQAVRLAYADGDDAYYVAVSAITQDAETMYRKLPYTGGETGLDVRHSLAPFPMWLAFLAKVSGMPAVTVAHVVLPVVLISMGYAVFYLLGVRLFPDKRSRLPIYLIFVELLVLFGDYSFYTMENFMIARSRQGKAALGSIVIPFLLLLLLIWLKKLQEGEKVPMRLYLLFAAGATTGCLCSTLGALLLCMMLGIVGLLGAVCYRRLRSLFPLAVCCIPCVCYALLYLMAAD